MDYFQGILFLTTNRVGQFDDAFASRIHLSLGYKKLDNKARAQIWVNLFEKLTEDYRKKIGPQVDFSISAKEYVRLKRVMDLEWNGREIRNGRDAPSQQCVQLS
jgi:ATP-dependent Clp protease ATP-binding subunit ClpA